MFGMFANQRDDREPLSPPLSTAPPGPHPTPPTLFLGAPEYFVTQCDDVLRNDLVFSSNAKPIHSFLEGKIEDLQLPILNYLSGKDVLCLSRALMGGSVIVTDDELIARGNASSFIENENGNALGDVYRGAISTDEWFDVDAEYQPLANNVFQALRTMYNAGCHVVMAATTGVYTAPRQLCTIFQIESQWTLRSYTTHTICKTELGRRILRDAFPFQNKYIKGHFVGAPMEECLFLEHVDPADYEYSECSDSDNDNDPVPDPCMDSPIVVHFGGNGGCLAYFGFVNDLDVSFGAIMLRLVNASYYNP
mmetsp:Transcript_5352/g.6261  ORF Transcript_5352/g.6261 Transcript_5352/m.6261 type:complete len:307 (-) Transcript_5352:104-1024(-)|eukprot:CAMPEP_0198268244 /NCGR_PEP_ID=MMETSP1447-20131203/36381_1 /TAXON_ID=420782 /ORGANISM="Chaetoceros dichaeta, Strain CCMP1751" /LENGTH=306 /DNA_ID=CAMNT_0043959187 /DNA_START=131 /DNA_END=1051 /DNA_ORIENTATION=+